MKSLLPLLAVFLAAPLCSVQAINVAAGKSVTLNGTFYDGDNGWAPSIDGAPSSLTDGAFLPAGTQWNLGTVWWNQTTYPANNIVIDLGGSFQITQLTAQADDNDTYQIDYWNGANWVSAWSVPAVFTFGLETRTSGAVNFTTSLLRFTATGGDSYVSVSEIQAEGRALQGVPDSGTTLTLLLIGLGSSALLRRKI